MPDIVLATLNAEYIHPTLRGHHLAAKTAEKRGNQRQTRHTHETAARSPQRRRMASARSFFTRVAHGRDVVTRLSF
jgi:hypothetical protein